MSVRKDYCTAFGIHPIPANIPKKDFEAKCEALVESFLALPVTQRNFLKFDIRDFAAATGSHLVADQACGTGGCG
jgi:hypothetical protein